MKKTNLQGDAILFDWYCTFIITSELHAIPGICLHLVEVGDSKGHKVGGHGYTHVEVVPHPAGLAFSKGQWKSLKQFYRYYFSLTVSKTVRFYL